MEVLLRMTLAVHPQLFSIHSFCYDTIIPNSVFTQPIYFVGKTSEELSIVVPEDLQLPSLEHEHGWRCIEILGPLNLSMTGILAKISGILAEINIAIFALSTFDTDYILLKKDKLSLAIKALSAQNYQIVEK